MDTRLLMVSASYHLISGSTTGGSIGLVVLAVFLAVIGQQYGRIDSLRARKYRARRSTVVREQRHGNHRRISCSIYDYRWHSRTAQAREKWYATLVVTDDSLWLSFRLVFLVFFGIPLMLPSYRIPISEICGVERLTEQRRLRLYWRLFYGVAHPPRRLSIRTRSGASCILEFRTELELGTVQFLLISMAGLSFD